MGNGINLDIAGERGRVSRQIRRQDLIVVVGIWQIMRYRHKPSSIVLCLSGIAAPRNAQDDFRPRISESAEGRPNDLSQPVRITDTRITLSVQASSETDLRINRDRTEEFRYVAGSIHRSQYIIVGIIRESIKDRCFPISLGTYLCLIGTTINGHLNPTTDLNLPTELGPDNIRNSIC